jgi:murein tripeptide amidase MpaA
MFRKNIIWLSVILFSACKAPSEFTGYSYDPPGVTDTKGRDISPQFRRIIGAGNPRVWLSNEFESARANDFYQINNNTFEVLIEAENYPINNSPWFAFTIWSDTLQAINLRLRYTNAKHRYEPKVYQQRGLMSYSHIITDAAYDSADGTTTFALYVDKNAVRVSGQLLEGARFSDLKRTLASYNQPFVTISTAGESNEGRPIFQLKIDETKTDQQKGVLVLLSRQHPPEVSGYRTYQAFFEALLADTELAREFRTYFVVYSFPMINPDGVVNGHWRHNARGVDLNRDWEFFNQPETRAVRDALLPLAADINYRVYYGIDFHSTNENIFYPIRQNIETFPDNLTQRWISTILPMFERLNFSTEEFDTNSPISKNWIFNTFGADALTFEVDDELGLNDIKSLGTTSAEHLMELLLQEWKSKIDNN